MVKHIQDTAPYQYPDNIWVKESRRDLGKMEKLFNQRRQRETEPYVELLLVKVGSKTVPTTNKQTEKDKCEEKQAHQSQKE